MNIKMIVTDLDGTILRDDKTVTDYTINILQKCRDKGIKLTFATGRGGTTQMDLPIDLFDGFALTNGALAFADGKKIYSKPIPIPSARQLLTAADKAGVSVAAEIGGRHCANFNVGEIWEYLEYEMIDFNGIDFEPHKIYAPVSSLKTVELLKSLLPDDLYMTVTRDDLAMVMHKDATKSKAIEALAAHWGIQQSEIVAFGDDLNDIDLLKYCGVSVAVSNALDEIKAIADFISDSNEDDGVAKWIYLYTSEEK